MGRTYLSLGSNLEDRYANLRLALARLQDRLTITALSPVYATEPWGGIDQPSFLNLCVGAVTDLDPMALLAFVKSVEIGMGRTSSVRWGPRLIDIDILFYEDLVLQSEGLTIPHPAIAERAFVLAPLADIIPEFRHPQTGQTVRQMLSQIDSSTVERLFEMPFPLSEPEISTPA